MRLQNPGPPFRVLTNFVLLWNVQSDIDQLSTVGIDDDDDPDAVGISAEWVPAAVVKFWTNQSYFRDIRELRDAGFNTVELAL